MEGLVSIKATWDKKKNGGLLDMRNMTVTDNCTLSFVGRPTVRLDDAVKVEGLQWRFLGAEKPSTTRSLSK